MGSNKHCIILILNYIIEIYVLLLLKMLFFGFNKYFYKQIIHIQNITIN